jgi:hypothetical protein
MPGKLQRSGKPYLTIVGGSFSQSSDEGTQGAKLRKYELKDGTKGEKWEIVYTDWEGIVTGISFEDGKYGKMLNLELEDAIISINTKSRYFQDLARRLFSADLTKPINFHPYDFEVDGVKKTGVSMHQGDPENKLKNYFYDGKQNLHGYPEPENRGSMDSDDWETFFKVKVRKFLIKKLEELEIPKKSPEEVVAQAGTPEAKAQVAEEVNEDIKIDDLPFDQTE